jgi:hypothetical protein
LLVVSWIRFKSFLYKEKLRIWIAAQSVFSQARFTISVLGDSRSAKYFFFGYAWSGLLERRLKGVNILNLGNKYMHCIPESD